MALGLLLDIDGVMVTSWKALPGAVEAVSRLADRDIPRMFLTNTTSRSRNEIAELLNDCGFSVDADEILTAAKLTAEYVSSTYPGKRVWVLNQGPIAEDMTEVELTDDPADAEVVVLGGAGSVFTHDSLSKVLEMLLDGVPVIAMHRSMTWSTADGLSIDTGVYLEGGLEKASGKKIKRSASRRRSDSGPPQTGWVSNRLRWSWSATTCTTTSWARSVGPHRRAGTYRQVPRGGGAECACA